MTTDRIEKHTLINAPVSRVWRAITDSNEFSKWFGITLEGPFVAGQTVRGTFNLTLDEAKIMAHQTQLGVQPSGIKMPEPHSVFCTVQLIEQERYFSFRWIPYGIDAEADLSSEPTTLVEFRLEPTVEGTRLTIVESGFDQVPAHRRARALRMNEGGWAAQAENIRKHVEGQ
jgi:uncharacterized protein YndB with AHSA1/START domain